MNNRGNQREVAELQTIYTFLLNKLNEGIHVVNRLGETIIYNAKMAEMESMRKEDVLHKNILDIFQFQHDENSTLLRALNSGQETLGVKQTYFNNRGQRITTINHTYPIRVGGTVVGAIEIAEDISKMERILHDNVLKQGDTRYTFASIIGESSAIREVIEDARRATRTNSSVLIVGETGTGKELFAQSIHNGSAKATGPFVSQNCAALPETLIESLLFGTARGAFSGAIDRPGLIESAHGGTLLLDELNSLGTALQAKLLRVLQEKKIRRIGDTKDKPVDVRIIATMNEDPLDAIMQNRLRKDLYYRLSVVTLFIPPLCQRIDDISLLVRSFIEKYNALFQMNVTSIDRSVMEMFQLYNWPGNVRELEHVIEGAMNMIGDGASIQFRDLPIHLRRRLITTATGPLVPDTTFQPVTEQVREFERAKIQSILQQHNGNISATARTLGISRQSLQYRLRKHEVEVDTLRHQDGE